MIGKLIVSGARATFDIIMDRRTGYRIENELHSDFRGESITFRNYKNNQVELSVESITVRPKYTPENQSSDVQQIEVDDIFSSLEDSRNSSSFSERFKAILTNHWITIVTLQIDTGELEDVCPPGLSLKRLSIMAAGTYSNEQDIDPIGFLTSPHVKGVETGEIHADKLKVKLPYSGSIGEYTEHITRAFDLIKRSQNQFQKYAFLQLLDLHHSHRSDHRNSTWSDRERAEQLGEFIFDMPVDTNLLANTIEEFKEDMADKHESKE